MKIYRERIACLSIAMYKQHTLRSANPESGPVQTSEGSFNPKIGASPTNQSLTAQQGDDNPGFQSFKDQQREVAPISDTVTLNATEPRL